MKKVLALVLAVVLAFGMTTVAFAEDEVFNFDVSADASLLTPEGAVEKGDEFLITNFAVYTMDDDDYVNSSNGVTLGSTVEPGKKLYIPVDGSKVVDSGNGLGNKYFNNVSELKNFRISYSVDDGKNMIKSVKFVKEKAKFSTFTGKALFIVIETNDNFIVEDQTLDFTLKLSGKNKGWVSTPAEMAPPSGKVFREISTDYNFSMEYTAETVGNGYFTVGPNVLEFDDDADDVTLCFDNEVEVQGNMKGQKKVFVRLSDSNDAIEEKYPDATVRFFDGNKDTFRRDLNVMIPYESAVEKPFLYEVDAKGTLTKVADAKYDDVAGAFNFKTKTLGNYLLSDTELKSKVDADANTDTDAPAEGDKPTDGTQPNPGTGANDFVGLAVALAVVSIAGIAVAKRK